MTQIPADRYAQLRAEVAGHNRRCYRQDAPAPRSLGVTLLADGEVVNPMHIRILEEVHI